MSNKHLDILIDEMRDVIDFEAGQLADGTEDATYILFQSWSDRDRFVERCKKYINDEDAKDYEIEQEFDVVFAFDDEFTTCSDCYGIIQTSPSHYGWQPDFYYGDGFVVCKKCFDTHEDYQEAYLEERINNPKNAVNGMVTTTQLEQLGFKKVNDDSYESGYHRGQTDDPESIYDELKSEYDEIVFFIDGVGQFDMHFSVWVRGE